MHGGTHATQPPDILDGARPLDVTGVPDDRDGTDPSGLLLVDARNGFNELSRKAMLWTVRHRWANGALFAFNCYRHAARLVLRSAGGPASTLLSQEGVTQGDPLSMILYGLTLVPLAASLREAVPEVLQPWYADDAAMVGPTGGIAKAVRLLEDQGPARGYYPEPAKSVFVPCRPTETHLCQADLAEFNFQYREGARYVGGFIGTDAALAEWIAPQTQQWADGVMKLGKVASRFPQTAYAGLVRSLQTEWTHLQRVVPGSQAYFDPVEQALTRSFLPRLLETDDANVASLRRLLALPVRQAGLGIPDPRDRAAPNYDASCAMTAPLITSLTDRSPLSALEYAVDASIQRDASRAARAREAEATSKELQAAASQLQARRMDRARETGAWLTAMPDTLNGTVLAAEEFRDSLRLRYGLTPTSLPGRCDGCGERFTVDHAMSCKKGGLVLLRHNDVCGEWGQLCAQALTPSAVSDEPLIHSSRDRRAADGTSPTDVDPELRGDIAAHGFWKRGATTIFDVRITDTDAKSYRGKDPRKVLASHEEAKKGKYADACLRQRRHFTPLVFSVDGLRGAEASAASKRLASLLAAKWHRTYSQVCGFVRSRLSIALVRATSRCLRADRKPFARPSLIPWDNGAGLALYR